MGQPIPTKLAEFDNGMTTNLRSGDVSKAAIVSGFDNYSDPNKLTPHRSMKLDATTESTLDSSRIAKFINTASGIYGFGQISDSDVHAQVYVKSTIATDPTEPWTLATNGSDAFNGGSRSDVLFKQYRQYLFGGNSTGIWKYNFQTPAFTYNDYTTHLASGQGLVVGDILYVPSNNLLLQNDLLTGAGWSVALTLDSSLSIKDLCEMPGGNIGIGCDRPDNTSLVYLWNRDTTQQPYDRIPWGNGSLQHVENLGGTLVGISISSTTGASLSPMVYFKYWNGSRLVPFETFACTVATFTGDKQKFNELFYFLAEITLNGTALKGLWKIFQKANGQFAVSFDRNPRNDTALDAGSLKGFQRIGDYLFISYLIPTTGAFTVWRTSNDLHPYPVTSVFETIILNSVMGKSRPIPDSSRYKDFMGATITTPALPSGAAVALKYKVDAGSSWIGPILTHNTQDALSTSITQLVARLPQHKELYLRLESTGGAEITGLDLLQDVTDKKPY